MAEELTKEEKKALKRKAKRENKGGLAKEFKAFITRGNVLDMSVGVIMGGAFNAIVTALTNILLAIATWAVPGGIKGLVTVLPAVNDAQKGLDGIGQFFDIKDLQKMTFQFAENNNAVVGTANADGTFTVTDTAGYAAMQSGLLGKYTLHGTTYTYNMSAVIDWGTFINAIISFLIIALTLFIIIKTVSSIKAANEAFKAQAEAKLKAMKAAEEAPVEEAAAEETPAE